MNKVAQSEGVVSVQFPLEQLPAVFQKFSPER
jgi:hypothetical protein